MKTLQFMPFMGWKKSINNANLNTKSISFVPEQLWSGFIYQDTVGNTGRDNVATQYIFPEKAWDATE